MMGWVRGRSCGWGWGGVGGDVVWRFGEGI